MSFSNAQVEIKKASGEKKESGYIVRLKENIDKQTHLAWIRERLSSSSSITYEYSNELRAYAGTFDTSTLDHLRACPDVEEIYEDSIGYGCDEQTFATWGLNRISQLDPLTDQNPRGNFIYKYPRDAGKGVNIYIIDSGVLLDHIEFQFLRSRAEWGWTAPGLPSEDDRGHGTGVASVAAGTFKGVMKEANIIAVKVLNSLNKAITSDVIQAMDFVAEDAKNRGQPAIANMSLGLNPNTVVDEQVKRLTEGGIHVVCAAGNKNVNARSYSPGRSPFSITVGASNITDRKWEDLNWGSVVDIFAPGEQIIVAGKASNNAERIAKGTSYATPHVSGIIASFITQFGNKPPAEMKKFVKDKALVDKLANIPTGTVNLLANNGNLF